MVADLRPNERPFARQVQLAGFDGAESARRLLDVTRGLEDDARVVRPRDRTRDIGDRFAKRLSCTVLARGADRGVTIVVPCRGSLDAETRVLHKQLSCARSRGIAHGTLLVDKVQRLASIGRRVWRVNDCVRDGRSLSTPIRTTDGPLAGSGGDRVCRLEPVPSRVAILRRLRGSRGEPPSILSGLWGVDDKLVAAICESVTLRWLANVRVRGNRRLADRLGSTSRSPAAYQVICARDRIVRGDCVVGCCTRHVLPCNLGHRHGTLSTMVELRWRRRTRLPGFVFLGCLDRRTLDDDAALPSLSTPGIALAVCRVDRSRFCHQPTCRSSRRAV